jgi:hypothetical protein
MRDVDDVSTVMLSDLRRPIGGGVVDDDHLERVADTPGGAHNRPHGRANVEFLIVGRDDERDHVTPVR